MTAHPNENYVSCIFDHTTGSYHPIERKVQPEARHVGVADDLTDWQLTKYSLGEFMRQYNIKHGEGPQVAILDAEEKYFGTVDEAPILLYHRVFIIKVLGVLRGRSEFFKTLLSQKDLVIYGSFMWRICRNLNTLIDYEGKDMSLADVNLDQFVDDLLDQIIVDDADIDIFLPSKVNDDVADLRWRDRDFMQYDWLSYTLQGDVAHEFFHEVYNTAQELTDPTEMCRMMKILHTNYKASLRQNVISYTTQVDFGKHRRITVQAHHWPNQHAITPARIMTEVFDAFFTVETMMFVVGTSVINSRLAIRGVSNGGFTVAEYFQKLKRLEFTMLKPDQCIPYLERIDQAKKRTFLQQRLDKYVKRYGFKMVKEVSEPCCDGCEPDSNNEILRAMAEEGVVKIKSMVSK